MDKPQVTGFVRIDKDRVYISVNDEGLIALRNALDVLASRLDIETARQLQEMRTALMPR